MNTMTRRMIGAGALALLLAAAPAFAQQKEPPVRVRGEIAKVDGSTLSVKARDGSMLTVKLNEKTRLSAIVPATLADIKPGSYIGVSSHPQPDGSQKAIHVHIFPEALRGIAEGHFKWDNQPGSMMTNATVVTTVASVDGQVISVKYKTGEQKIVVPKGAPIVTYLPGKLDELNPGVKIFIVAAQKQPDGSLLAPSLNFGRDGLIPPM
jgi:hypothetical protein